MNNTPYLFSNCDDGKGDVYSLEYWSPYASGSELYYNVNSLVYSVNQYYNAGNIHVVVRKLCKRHKKYNASWRFGQCCRIVDKF